MKKCFKNLAKMQQKCQESTEKASKQHRNCKNKTKMCQKYTTNVRQESGININPVKKAEKDKILIKNVVITAILTDQPFLYIPCRK